MTWMGYQVALPRKPWVVPLAGALEHKEMEIQTQCIFQFVICNL